MPHYVVAAWDGLQGSVRMDDKHAVSTIKLPIV